MNNSLQFIPRLKASKTLTTIIHFDDCVLIMGFLRSAVILCTVAILVALVMKVAEKEKLPIIVEGSVEPGFEEVLKVFR